MNHDFESKAWADNHQVMSDGIANLFSSMAKGAARLRARMAATRPGIEPAIARPSQTERQAPLT